MRQPFRPTPMPYASDRSREIVIAADGALFAWRGAGIVLYGEWDGDVWALSRGWRGGDKLTDIRRWSFPNAVRFVAQIRRLVDDATGDRVRATDAASAAAEWVQVQSGQRLDPA